MSDGDRAGGQTRLRELFEELHVARWRPLGWLHLLLLMRGVVKVVMKGPLLMFGL